MQTVLHYLELRFFFQDYEVQTPFPATVEKLADVWHCTPRYVKLIVRKLSNLGWIHWQAGKGRGHTSVLTLLADSNEILLEEAKNRVEQGDVKEAMGLMNRFGETTVKDRFMEWLSEGMGFSTKNVSDRLQDTLRFPVYRTIFTLDPGLVYYAFESHIAGQLFNTLVEYDQMSRTVIPCIAHSWESTRDAREWTFHLKKGILFHHGREMTADDVVFTLDRLRLHPDRFDTSWMFQDIERIEAVDHKTVRIHLTEPNYVFLRFLCTIHASIVPAEIVRNNEAEFAKNPVGTGPFGMVRYNEGVCILEAFPLHFRGRPQLDRVEVLILPEMEAGCLKEPDWTSVMSSHGDTSQANQSLEDDWCGMETMSSCCNLLVFNQGKTGPQNHPQFREALHYILDREQMIADLGDNLASPAIGFRPLPPPSDKPTEEDPACHRSEIEALLDASGYKGEIFYLTTNSYHEAEAAWITDRCRSFGVNMDFHIHQVFPDSSDRPYDAWLFGFVHNNDDISELELFAQKNYLLPAFDQPMTDMVKKTVQSILREPSEKERQRKIANLEDMMRQTYSVLFLVHRKSSTAYHKSVRGVSINAFGWLDFHKIWFQPQV